jgi:hypothetical protein
LFVENFLLGALAGQWRIAEGAHRFALAKSAANVALTDDLTLSGRVFGK